MLAAMGQGAEAYLARTVYGSPEDVIERLSEYVAKGLDKFVLWPIAEPAAWPKQIELVGREIASHYQRAS
jgi:alkanesulfonate monooxygenase SsuD/methylene tetrahydromethanopterin reductase-like flavin-dependent oxidoreductase (luciferase family)